MITLDGTSLSPAAVATVARDREPVSLAEAARARNEQARAAIADRVERGELLYGATTGVGALRDHLVPEAEREKLQWNLLRSHAVAAGPPVAPEIVRAGMVVRANQLSGGGGGVHPELLDALVQALNEDVIPVTRALGSLGTGDLPALADIALALLGEGRVWRGDEAIDAPALAPGTRLGLRDALGFMSSNAVTAGHAALISIDAVALLDAWLCVAALAFEALDADPAVLDERVQDAHGIPGQTAVAARLRSFLAGSSLEGAVPRRLVQGPYPFRVLPQVDGVSYDALTALEQVVTAELNARPENALIAGGAALPNGNFHAAALAAVLDSARAALAQSATLIAARVSALIDPRMTGLAPFLAGRPGPESGVMMLEYTAQAAAAELRGVAAPMAVQSVWASLGVESHGSLAATAARRTTDALEALRVLVGCELVVALRALRAAGREPAGAGSRRLYRAAAEQLPTGLEDRAFGHEVQAACALLADWRP